MDEDRKRKVGVAKGLELIIKEFRRAIVLDCAHFLTVSFNPVAASGEFSAECCPKSPRPFM